MIVTIREAKLDDYEKLLKLYADFVKEDRYAYHDNDSFKNVLESDSSFLYVAEAESKLIGFIVFSTRFVVRFPRKILQVDELFVAEDVRKHGVGQRLLEVAEEKARDLNCGRIYIESGIKRTGAHTFYEVMGYENGGYYFKKTL